MFPTTSPLQKLLLCMALSVTTLPVQAEILTFKDDGKAIHFDTDSFRFTTAQKDSFNAETKLFSADEPDIYLEVLVNIHCSNQTMTLIRGKMIQTETGEIISETDDVTPPRKANTDTDFKIIRDTCAYSKKLK